MVFLPDWLRLLNPRTVANGVPLEVPRPGESIE
jgi:hypothetical protein